MEKVRAAAGGVVLVTGSSRGLGRVMALRLGAAGYTVAVNYWQSQSDADSAVEHIVTAGGKAAAFRADMAAPDQARALVDRVESALGPLTALVSNAGITRDRLLLQMSEADWNATWYTDFAGPRAICSEALARMCSRGTGRIVTISSVVGVTGNAGQANYAAAKAAVQGLTTQLAVQGAPAGVAVNCIVPGYFATDATSHLTEAQRQAWYVQIPMKRAGSPDDIAELALFLLGPGAGYITGQCIAVDGGLTAARSLRIPP
jgi:3-oxoacyl-[acyl-carrier protein] reductase